MRNQRALNFGGTNPAAVYLEQIIGAAGVPQVAAFVLIILVSGSEPVAQNRVFGFLVLIPVAGASGVRLHQQAADFAARNIAILIVNDSCFQSGEYLPARSRTHLAG